MENRMDKSRRSFLVAGAAAGAGVLAASTSARAEEKQPAPMVMVAACGLSCTVCPLMKARKCSGCASGTAATPELLKAKPCIVLHCAADKKIEYCGTGCDMFTTCRKLIGRPYAETFLQGLARRLQA
jgi:hypothetical protein